MKSSRSPILPSYKNCTALQSLAPRSKNSSKHSKAGSWHMESIVRCGSQRLSDRCHFQTVGARRGQSFTQSEFAAKFEIVRSSTIASWSSPAAMSKYSTSSAGTWGWGEWRSARLKPASRIANAGAVIQRRTKLGMVDGGVLCRMDRRTFLAKKAEGAAVGRARPSNSHSVSFSVRSSFMSHQTRLDGRSCAKN